MDLYRRKWKELTDEERKEWDDSGLFDEISFDEIKAMRSTGIRRFRR